MPRSAPRATEPGSRVAIPALSGAEDLRGGVWPRSFALWWVAAYLAVFLIRPWEVLFPELGEIRFERIVVIVTVVLIGILAGHRLRFSAQMVAAFGLLFAVWLSSLGAIDRQLADIETREFLGIVISFCLILAVVRTPYQLMFLITCFLVAMAVYVAKCEWEYFVHGAGMYTMGVHRLAGVNDTYGHPNTLAASCVVSLAFLRLLYRSRREFCATWPKRWTQAFELFLLGYGGLAVTAVLLTRSRAGMLALGAFAFLVAWEGASLRRKARSLVLAAILLVGVFAALPVDMRQRLETIWNPDIEYTTGQGGAKESAWGRWYGFLAGVEIFQRHPTTGVGIGNFTDYRAAVVDGVRLNAHNLPGELMAELGIVGILAFAGFLAVLLRNARWLQRVGRREATPDAVVLARLGHACQLAVLLLLFEGLASHNLQNFLWMWVAAFALIGVQWCRARARSPQSPQSAGSPPLRAAQGATP